MKIAVIAPSPVPFVIGGIENLVWAMCDYLNQHTPHQAELIKLPSREHGFWELIDSYKSFYQLDVSHFDAVIVTKYPGWMVEHPNCIYYVAHRLRGLYDTWHLMGLPDEVKSENPYVQQVLDYMEEHPHPASLDTFFELLEELRAHVIPESQNPFSFPGPLIRKLVHYMDDFAFLRNNPDQYFAISKTVAARKEYFPEGAEVVAVYPPSALKGSTCKEFRHIFMVSRLDAPKRIDLLVRAMKHVKSDISLLIAGSGPERERLEALAEGDARIRFLGFVSDEEVEQYYADALVVPYFPKEEDYGYITVEAMTHGKPVITLKDSGGPTEFVRDYETGFLAEGTPESIAEKIDWMAAHPDRARAMGEKARKLVQGITWEKVIRTLLESPADETMFEMPAVSSSDGKETGRRRISYLSTFYVYPASGGGQVRSLSICRELAKTHHVSVITLQDRKSRRRISAGLTQIQCQRSREQTEELTGISRDAGIPAEDIAHLLYTHKSEDYEKELKAAAKQSDLLILNHPYTWPEIRPYRGNTPFIYEAQDVEYLIKRSMLPEGPKKQGILQRIFAAEKACCEESLLVLTCSEEDKENLAALYRIPEEKILVIPNGVDCAATVYTSPVLRTLKKKSLGLQEEKIALFMGSWHGPNLEACEQIFRIAPFCPGTRFLLMGSQCAYFEAKKTRIPGNVSLLGRVSEEEKNRLFSVADLALNPMLSGSGTNLKMFDYMAAGLPVITTEFGARGIDRTDLLTIAEPVAGMAAAIRDFDPEKYEKRTAAARKYIEEVFDWEAIVRPLKEYLEKNLPVKGQMATLR